MLQTLGRARTSSYDAGGRISSYDETWALSAGEALLQLLTPAPQEVEEIVEPEFWPGRLAGRAPTGYVAPWWEFSTVTNELLLERGIKYDHSLMHKDFEPYYVRVGDKWTKIDYSKKPEEWMVPLERGEETDLIEIPASWYLDDLPPMMFIKKSPNSHGFVNPRDIEEMWRDQFDWVYREYDHAVFPMTIHPDVSGRPHVLMMLERLYHYMAGHPGVKFVTMNEMADDFARRSPRKK